MLVSVDERSDPAPCRPALRSPKGEAGSRLVGLRPFVGPARRLLRGAARACRLARPVFVIGPPRCGSTLLFDALAETGQFHYYPRENDWVWWRLFPPGRLTEPSDWVGAADVRRVGPAAVRDGFRDQLLGGYSGRFAGRRRLGRLASLVLRPGRPFLDKTIANCFHLDALAAVFPAARYVLLVREPRATVSSMMEGWAHPDRFGKPLVGAHLAELPGRTIDHWCYPAPPGWSRVVARPLAEICAWSWRRHVEGALEGLARAGVAPIRLRYERLAARPAEVLGELADRLEVPVPRAVRAAWRRRPLARTTVSPPEPDKWRRLHGAAIEAVLPQLVATAGRIGYNLSARPEAPGTRMTRIETDATETGLM